MSFLKKLFIIYHILLIFEIKYANCAYNTTILNIITKQNSIDFINSQQHLSSNKYCNLCCINVQTGGIGKNCGSHTLCRYPAAEFGPNCAGYVKIRFTRTEQLAILDAHNTLRNKVARGHEFRGMNGPQPKASNMRLMEWNAELTLIAERWAAQCIFSNDLCRDLEKYPVGQNIAKGNVAMSNELNLIYSWYEGVEYFNESLVKSYKLALNGETNYSQYSQIIWADSYEIGCARAVFQDSKGSKVFYIEHLICNYGPTGNLPDQPAYKIGNPCSDCHAGTVCNSVYPGLCASANNDDLFDYFQKTQITNNCRNKENVTWILIATVNIILYCLLIKSF